MLFRSLGPAPSSVFTFDPRARGPSPGGERSLGVAFDSRGGSKSSSESGSQAHLRGYDQASPRSAETHFHGGNTHDFGGQLAQNGHPNVPSSSFSSSAGLGSPLSPHVQPFSPSTANGGSWGTAGGKAFNGQQQVRLVPPRKGLGDAGLGS